jgi:sulfur-carrier protein adenylyltransferase/sulfurtransferase
MTTTLPTNAAALPELEPAELRRYARHLILPEVGPEGQRRLKAARVLLVGTGGLGSPLGLYLAAAGVGTLGLVDFDRVDESNLQRQVLYGQSDVGRPKVEAAAERLADVNPHVRTVLHPVRLDSSNAREVIAGYDLVVDGSDNFPTRYLVNDACVLAGKANVYGSIFRFEGQVSVFWGARGPCYRCLFPEPPPPGLVPSCAEGGVFGVLPGIIGALQANEAIKLILGVGEPLLGRLLLFDALRLEFRELRLRKNPECPVCSEHPTQTELIDYEAFCGVGAEAPPAADEAAAADESELAPRELKRWLDEGREVVLLDVRNPYEHQLCRLPDCVLIPLHELPDRLGELDSEATIVAYCHGGMRSEQAVGFLRDQGFRHAVNLAGGIDAWSLEVDPSVPRY